MAKYSRNRSIDLLRGYSALLVVVAHLSQIQLPTGKLEAAIVERAFRNGSFGVSIFFAISGFLITSNILSRDGAPSAVLLRRFYAYRVARIIPLLLLILAVLWALAILFPGSFGVGPAHDIGRMTVAALTFRFNEYFIAHNTPSLPWGVLWSLSVEEQFYLAYPLLCKLCRTNRRLELLLIAIIVASTGFCLAGLPVHATLVCAGQLASGALAALLVVNPRIKTVLETKAAYFLWTGALVIMTLNLSTDASWEFSSPLVALGAALCLLGSQRVQPREKARWGSWLESIGIYSYEIYMIHGIVLWALRGPGVAALSPGYGDLAILAIFGVIYGISLLVSRFYSEPLNHFLRRALTTERA